MIFDKFNLSEDIFDILFATEQQKLVAKLLIEYIKENEREITKTEMSFFATKLHEGKYVFSGELINLAFSFSSILLPAKPITFPVILNRVNIIRFLKRSI